jgi:uncharacterized protein YoxC
MLKAKAIMIDDDEPRVVRVKAQTQIAQNLIDSLIIRWSKAVMSIVVIPIMLAGIYHIWDASDNHTKSLAGIEVSINDIKHTIDDLKEAQKDLPNTVASIGDIKNSIGDLKDSQQNLANTVAQISEQQQLDAKNIAGLQQADLDRHSNYEATPPAPAPEPVAPASEPVTKPRHHAIREQPNIFAAISKIFSPSHGLKARAEYR